MQFLSRENSEKNSEAIYWLTGVLLFPSHSHHYHHLLVLCLHPSLIHTWLDMNLSSHAFYRTKKIKENKLKINFSKLTIFLPFLINHLFLIFFSFFLLTTDISFQHVIEFLFSSPFLAHLVNILFLFFFSFPQKVRSWT